MSSGEMGGFGRVGREEGSVGRVPTGDLRGGDQTLIGEMTDQLVNPDWSLPKYE